MPFGMGPGMFQLPMGLTPSTLPSTMVMEDSFGVTDQMNSMQPQVIRGYNSFATAMPNLRNQYALG